MYFKYYSRRGFSLVELIVAIGLISIVGLALYGSWQFILQVLQGAKYRTTAVGIAQERLEIIRNMVYEDIGVIGSIPSGVLTAETQEVRNGVSFRIRQDVRYVDDSYDGLAPQDTLNTDYKQVRVEVSWIGYDNDQPVIIWSNVAPRGVETNVGGGTLRIEVIDTTPAPLPGAFVRIFNSSVVPAVDFTVATNSQGIVLVPGIPVSTSSYKVTVTKNGFTSAQTYDQDSQNNPNPDPGHLSIVEGLVTDKTFIIDDFSSLNIRVRDQENSPIQNVELRLTGQKHIGYDGFGQPIRAYNQTHVTNPGGEININAIDFDTYDVTFDGQPPAFDVASSGPSLPFVLSPAEKVNLGLILAPHTNHSLLLKILNNDEQVIVGATARLFVPSGFDETKTTDKNGYVFFSGLSPVEMNLEVNAPLYQPTNSFLPISGTMQQVITLADE